ncbi:MAG: hypothetical protein JNK67_09130 [Alphaproteobacteria bacterium]|nr:hypothetical protein [Alphaproteobacteria bacterium]
MTGGPRAVAIVVVAGDDLRLFSSADAAEARIAPEEVRSGRCTGAFTRNGRRLRFQIHDDGWGHETLRLVPADDAPSDAEALRTRIATFLSCRGLAVPTHATLKDLLRRAGPFCEL